MCRWNSPLSWGTSTCGRGELGSLCRGELRVVFVLLLSQGPVRAGFAASRQGRAGQGGGHRY